MDTIQLFITRFEHFCISLYFFFRLSFHFTCNAFNIIPSILLTSSDKGIKIPSRPISKTLETENHHTNSISCPQKDVLNYIISLSITSSRSCSFSSCSSAVKASPTSIKVNDAVSNLSELIMEHKQALQEVRILKFKTHRPDHLHQKHPLLDSFETEAIP